MNLAPAWVGGDILGVGPVGRVPPWRYYQRPNGVALTDEVEIPNLKSISIDRNIDTDAASCNIAIYNQWIDNNGVATELANQLGKPGYFTFNRGSSGEGQARWGHVTNSWNNVLTPMALLRTYQGFGGYDADNHAMSLADAIAGGWITLTGTWFVDSVTIGTDGLITIQARDAAKLLIEQFLYPPLVPPSAYPLKYFKWIDTASIWDPGPGLGTNNGTPIPLAYANSATDILLGSYNAPVLGYLPSNSCDGNNNTTSFGYGYDTPDAANAVDFWEYTGAGGAPIGDIDRVYVSPWGGPYTCYVSVMVAGVWQGAITIPFTAIPFPGSADAIGADIAAVLQGGVSADNPTWFQLPSRMHADRVRISFRDLKISPSITVGPYRSGLRDAGVNISPVAAGSASNTYAIALFSDNSLPVQPDGYWVIDATGQQFFFGGARTLAENSPVGLSAQIIDAVGHPSSPGFWTLETNGRVHSYGAATHFGDDAANGNNDYIGIACTHTGQGYHLLRRTGGVTTHGDAQYMAGTFLGAPTLGELPAAADVNLTATAITGHPTAYGYWITDFVGQVGNFGAGGYYGQVSPPLSPGNPGAIVSTNDGTGYWILWTNGQVFNYGSAINHGGAGPQANPVGIDAWVAMIRSRTTTGYWLLQASGSIGTQGAPFFGEPASTGPILREPGNYDDYATIVRDLLMWAGFWVTGTQGDQVYSDANGYIQATYAYAEDSISEDVFDKKPVIDAITTIKEIVGYLFWVDEIGGAHFQAPNWWKPGNTTQTGAPTSFIPEVDERVQLTQYSMTFNDKDLRSEIIIANSLPETGNTDVVTTHYTPPGQNLLRGLVRPAIWSNEVFSLPAEQAVMAELIGLHIWFSQRQGQVTCVANPCIQVNDQIRIWERVSAESFIHYVRGISTSMDFDTGEYVMTVSTHWLGSDSGWVIQPSGANPTMQNNVFVVSPATLAFIGRTKPMTSTGGAGGGGVGPGGGGALPAPALTAAPTSGSGYAWHTGIQTSWFYVSQGGDNDSVWQVGPALSSHQWVSHYGGPDLPFAAGVRTAPNYYPTDHTPVENPYYFALPYNDFSGTSVKAERLTVVPWAPATDPGAGTSILKNRWIQIRFNGRDCYAQWQDVGPVLENDSGYVFGTVAPAGASGLNVSPAVRDYLAATGVNENPLMDWRFVNAADVPAGPWRNYVTTSQVDFA